MEHLPPSIVPETPKGVPVTLVLNLKHALLYEAAKRLGSQKKLAEDLGVSVMLVSAWINLRACPPKEPNNFWTRRRIRTLEARLFRITGKTLDELFPDELRDDVKFREAPKKFEKTIYLREQALEHHANLTRQRLAPPDPDKVIEIEENSEKLHELADKARLCQRERLVIKKRYPKDGMSMTLEEVGKELRISRERVRQIEEKAIRKMQRAAGVWASRFPVSYHHLEVPPLPPFSEQTS